MKATLGRGKLTMKESLYIQPWRKKNPEDNVSPIAGKDGSKHKP